MQLKIDISQQFDELDEAAYGIIERTLELVSQQLFASIRIESPVDTGRLANSFVLERKAALSHSVETNVSYAMAVQEGSGPRVIKPVNALALFWKGARHPVKSVNHPGTRANPFATRAIDAASRRVEEFAETAAEEVKDKYGL